MGCCAASLPPPLPPKMSVSRLPRTLVCAAAAAEAEAEAEAADAEAARLEDPGHGFPSSGTSSSLKLGRC